MKCSNCGAELADGAKFCGECGTKVPTSNKCPECGAVCAPGGKFCSECGHKMSGPAAQKSVESDAEEEEETPMMTVADFFGVEEQAPKKTGGEEDSCKIDWDGKALEAEIMMPLSDQQCADIAYDLDSLKMNAHEGHIWVAGDDYDGYEFDAKFKAFKDEYSNRLGVNMDSFPLFQKDCVIGLIDNSKSGTCKRGTLFTRLGMIVMDGDFPKVIEGDEPLDGIVPWKLFYLFAEPRDESSYRIMKPIAASKSDMVEEALRNKIKADTNKPGGNLNLLLRFGNVGVSAEDIAEFVDGLKGSLAEYDVATEDDEEEEEEED